MGVLEVQVPTNLPETDVEVVLVVQVVPAVREPAKGKTPEELGWPPGFFERTFGCWEGEPMERPPQCEPLPGTRLHLRLSLAGRAGFSRVFHSRIHCRWAGVSGNLSSGP
jgi:hypothetical protein